MKYPLELSHMVIYFSSTPLKSQIKRERERRKRGEEEKEKVEKDIT